MLDAAARPAPASISLPVPKYPAKDTIEEQLVKLHAEKRQLADGILAGKSERLSTDDLLALLREGGDRVRWRRARVELLLSGSRPPVAGVMVIRIRRCQGRG